MQLEHDVPDMHFDRALAHMEFVGDGLVPLTLPKALQNLNLARREPVCAPVVLGMHGVFSISKGHCHPPILDRSPIRWCLDALAAALLDALLLVEATGYAVKIPQRLGKASKP
jgi:hypothetical protein